MQTRELADSYQQRPSVRYFRTPLSVQFTVYSRDITGQLIYDELLVVITSNGEQKSFHRRQQWLPIGPTSPNWYRGRNLITIVYLANLCKKNCSVYIQCKGDIVVVDIK